MKIFCIGRNYIDHAKELNNKIPEQPLVFIKPSTALLRNNEAFYIPDFSDEIHYELELVLKVTKPGKHIQQKFAAEYFSEVGLGIDFTARDLQSQLKSKGHPWEISKAFDNSAAVSKFIPVVDKTKAFSFSLQKNEKLVQQGLSSDMIFPISRLISHISTYFTLQQGDLIFTGTPAGVGKVEIGDRLVAELEGIKLLDFMIK